MILTHLYYLGALSLLLHEFIWIVNPIETAEIARTRNRLLDENKKTKWEDRPQELKDMDYLLYWNAAIFLWVLVGVFTSQWSAFLLYFILELAIFAPIFKLTIKTKAPYYIAHFVNSVIGAAFAIFIIVNAYHLHYDPAKLIMSLLNLN